MYCQTCYEECHKGQNNGQMISPDQYIFTFDQIAVHGTHKFESLQAFKEKKLQQLLKGDFTEVETYLNKEFPTNINNIVKAFQNKAKNQLNDYKAQLTQIQVHNGLLDADKCKELLSKIEIKNNIKQNCQNLLNQMKALYQSFNILCDNGQQIQPSDQNVPLNNNDELNIEDFIEKKNDNILSAQIISNQEDEAYQINLDFPAVENDESAFKEVEPAKAQPKPEVPFIKQEHSNFQENPNEVLSSVFDRVREKKSNEMPKQQLDQFQQRIYDPLQAAKDYKSKPAYGVPLYERASLERAKSEQLSEQNLKNLEKRLEQNEKELIGKRKKREGNDQYDVPDFLDNIYQNRRQQLDEPKQNLQGALNKWSFNNEEMKSPFSNGSSKIAEKDVFQKVRETLKTNQNKDLRKGQDEDQQWDLRYVYREKINNQRSCMVPLNYPNLYGYTEQGTGMFYIHNTNIKEKYLFCQNLNVDEAGQVISIVQTLRDKSNRIFFLTKKSLFCYEFNEENQTKFFFRNRKQINIKTSYDFIDMLYLDHLGQEYLYILDSHNVYRVELSQTNQFCNFLEVEFILGLEKKPELTCFTGKYFERHKSVILYIGDLNGTVHGFHCENMLIKDTFKMFNSKKKGPNMNTIHQLVMVQEKQENLYLVAIKHQKRKLGIISLNEMVYPLTYFKLEESIIKLHVHKSIDKNGQPSFQQFLMVVTDKALEVMDFTYLMISQEVGFFKEFIFKFRLGYPEVVQICSVNGLYKNIHCSGLADRFCFSFAMKSQLDRKQ